MQLWNIFKQATEQNFSFTNMESARKKGPHNLTTHESVLYYTKTRLRTDCIKLNDHHFLCVVHFHHISHLRSINFVLLVVRNNFTYIHMVQEASVVGVEKEKIIISYLPVLVLTSHMFLQWTDLHHATFHSDHCISLMIDRLYSSLQVSSLYRARR